MTGKNRTKQEIESIINGKISSHKVFKLVMVKIFRIGATDSSTRSELNPLSCVCFEVLYNESVADFESENCSIDHSVGFHVDFVIYYSGSVTL